MVIEAHGTAQFGNQQHAQHDKPIDEAFHF
jgi:hypothetical protein